MPSGLYDALKEAGATEDKARKAAEAVASFDDRFHRIERKIDAGLAAVDQKFGAVEVRFARIEGGMILLKWMMGGLYAVVVPGLLVLLRVGSETGAFG